MKQVLLIVYYWPPSGGAGVQRWLKFARYLPQWGIKPTVITTKDGDYPALDASLEAEVPTTLKVIRTHTPTFSGFYRRIFGAGSAVPYGTMQPDKDASLLKRLSFWVRRNFVIPDMRVIWNRYALAAAIEELKTTPYDAVITTGPPHSTHLVGRAIKRRFSIPWLADFRDPWSEIDYLRGTQRTVLTQTVDRALEQKVVRDADVITAPTRAILRSLAVADGILLYNGFDEADFASIPACRTSDVFSIHYFGVLSPERTPMALLDALNNVMELHPDWEIEVHFWGNIAPEVSLEIEKHPQRTRVKRHGYVSHREVIARMKGADVLLLIINNVPENEGIITGKLFEYIGSGLPVIALGPPAGEAADILCGSAAGKMFDYEDIDGLANFLIARYQGEVFLHPEEKTKNLRYSRRALTRQLSEILKEL